MYRIQPTGNATFDAAEVAAYQIYQQQLSVYGREPVPERALPQLEIGYLFACWDTARIYTAAVNPLDNTSNLVKIPANTGVSLDPLANNLATQLRDRGFRLPAGFYLAQSAVVLSGGSTNAAVVGDILTATDGATLKGSRKTNATFTVATVDAGPIPVTVTLRTPGFYSTLPTGGAATTVNTAAYTDCTLTITFLFVPTTYNY